MKTQRTQERSEKESTIIMRNINPRSRTFEVAGGWVLLTTKQCYASVSDTRCHYYFRTSIKQRIYAGRNRGINRTSSSLEHIRGDVVITIILAKIRLRLLQRQCAYLIDRKKMSSVYMIKRTRTFITAAHSQKCFPPTDRICKSDGEKTDIPETQIFWANNTNGNRTTFLERVCFKPH